MPAMMCARTECVPSTPDRGATHAQQLGGRSRSRRLFEAFPLSVRKAVAVASASDKPRLSELGAAAMLRSKLHSRDVL